MTWSLLRCGGDATACNLIYTPFSPLDATAWKIRIYEYDEKSRRVLPAVAVERATGAKSDWFEYLNTLQVRRFKNLAHNVQGSRAASTPLGNVLTVFGQHNIARR